MGEQLQDTLDKVITLIAREIADRCLKEIERVRAQKRSQSTASDAVVQTAAARPRAENALLKIKEVQARVTLSRSAIYQLCKRGKFPKPIKIGSRAAWSESSIAQWIAELQQPRKGRTSST